MTPDEVTQLTKFAKVATGHSAFYQTSAANYSNLGTKIRICQGTERIECKEVSVEQFKADIQAAFDLSAEQASQVFDTIAADKPDSSVIQLFA